MAAGTTRGDGANVKAVKVFVAGATGVLGHRAVGLLIGHGHAVTGVARGPARAELLRSLGATPASVDLFDTDAVRAAVQGHDVVFNLATHIPAPSRMAMPGAWKENDRLRTEASRHLADATIAADIGRFVQESIAFVYRPNGDNWIDESSPVDAVANIRSALAAESNAARVTEAGGSGVALRFAAFYGPDSNTTQAMVRMARRRVALGAAPAAFVSSITSDDAASAVLATLSAPPGVYNVGDDEPVTRREFFAALADALGVPPPVVAPAALAKALGKKAAAPFRSQRLSNRRFRQATGWAPTNASVHQGWPVVVAALAHHH